MRTDEGKSEMTNTEDYDDISWLDETNFDSKGPLSRQAKATLETMKLKRDAALDEGRHEAFSEIRAVARPLPLLYATVIRPPTIRGRQKARYESGASLTKQSTVRCL
jgi:hypothetical protein